MRRDASTQIGYDRAMVDAVLDAILARLPPRRASWLVGLSGVQGSGKSTLARQLAAAASRRGVRTQVLALDDFYLGRRERARLARKTHALLATRGVPGTHDLALLDGTLRALKSATTARPARIPRFDKGSDTRLPPSRWPRVTAAPRLILLEGWCVGVSAEDAGRLARPVNDLERIDDADGRWRAWVNARLAGDYKRLWRRLDALVALLAPDFAIVQRWRDEQERTLRRRRAPHALAPAMLRRFVMHYERLSRHALRTLPAIADVLVTLDEARRVRTIRVTGARPQRTGSTTTAVP
jgi:D-glycerate 3-kinase